MPGNVVMAILLGAFLIQGLIPGPSMLTANVTLTYTFVWFIVIANVITVAFCFLLLNQRLAVSCQQLARYPIKSFLPYSNCL